MTPDPRLAAGMRALIARREADLTAGERPLGWKIGINVEAVQQRLGIDSPVVGYLTTATELSPDVPATVGSFARPMLEPEIAIHLGEPVGADASREAAAAAIAGLGAAFELVDIDLPFEDVEAILAGNVFHRGVLFGPPSPDVAPSAVRVRASGQDDLTATFEDDPVEVVRFAAAFLAEHNATLEAGDRIIAGSLTPPIAVRPGARVEADYGPLGELSLDLED